MLEKKEKVLLKKASAEVEKAKEFTKAKNKRGIVAIYAEIYIKFQWNWLTFDFVNHSSFHVWFLDVSKDKKLSCSLPCDGF